MAHWALVTAEKSEPRARVLLAVAAELATAGIPAGGYVQGRGEIEGRGCQTLERVGRRGRATLAVDGVAPKGKGQVGFCTFAFRRRAFATARRWVEQDAARCRALFVDGVGKMEAAGDGHAGTLRWALDHHDGLLVLGVRASQLFGVIERYGLDPSEALALELPASDAAVRAFVEELVHACGASVAAAGAARRGR